MLKLDATTRKIQTVLSGAVTTNQLPCMVSYSDDNGTTYVGGTQLTNTNSTTAVDICAAPGASTVRDIDYLSIRNRDTAAATVTVMLDDNATDYEIVKAVLSVGDQLVYTHGMGWQVIAANGSLKTGLGGDVVGPASATDNAIARFDGATGKLVQNSTVLIDDSGNVTIPGNTTLGDAVGDTVTVNAGTMSIPNGLNIDSNTLVIDAANNIVSLGSISRFTLDQVGSYRHILGGSSTSTTGADGTGGVVIANTDTTTNNLSSVAFGAVTGALNHLYVAALIQCIHGARTNGQYHSGDLIFSTAPGSNVAPIVRVRIDKDGNTYLTSPALLGYGTGAGGTVTQTTSKSTAVTLNKPCGQITMHNASLGAGASVVFTCNNSLVTSTSCVSITSHYSIDNYRIEHAVYAGGAIQFKLTNLTAGALAESVDFMFQIHMGATS